VSKKGMLGSRQKAKAAAARCWRFCWAYREMIIIMDSKLDDPVKKISLGLSRIVCP
jgi:hypothetical protein